MKLPLACSTLIFGGPVQWSIRILWHGFSRHAERYSNDSAQYGADTNPQGHRVRRCPYRNSDANSYCGPSCCLPTLHTSSPDAIPNPWMFHHQRVDRTAPQAEQSSEPMGYTPARGGIATPFSLDHCTEAFSPIGSRLRRAANAQGWQTDTPLAVIWPPKSLFNSRAGAKQDAHRMVTQAASSVFSEERGRSFRKNKTLKSGSPQNEHPPFRLVTIGFHSFPPVPGREMFWLPKQIP